MPSKDSVRVSGKSGGTEAAEHEMEELIKDLEPEMDVEREKTISTPGFSRMKTDLKGEDAHMFMLARDSAEGTIRDRFADAFGVMQDLYEIVRDPVINERTGEIKTDHLGDIVWQTNATGSYVEDWNRLGQKEKENFLHRITIALFEWEQRKEDLWLEAMLSKGIWQERFASEYGQGMGGTVDDRTHRANERSAEQKYTAIYLTSLSRRAESLCRSMERLALRMRDSLQS
jgi:hypothetical protein